MLDVFPVITKTISLLLAGKIIRIQATDCRNHIFVLGKCTGSMGV